MDVYVRFLPINTLFLFANRTASQGDLFVEWCLPLCTALVDMVARRFFSASCRNYATLCLSKGTAQILHKIIWSLRSDCDWFRLEFTLTDIASSSRLATPTISCGYRSIGMHRVSFGPNQWTTTINIHASLPAFGSIHIPFWENQIETNLGIAIGIMGSLLSDNYYHFFFTAGDQLPTPN